MANKRKFPRLANDWILKYRKIKRNGHQENPLNSLMLNLSGGGVCFTATEELAPETAVALEMQPPDLESPVIAIANTIWCKKRRRDNLFDIGCEFWWIGWKDDNAQAQLADYIKTNTKDCNGQACALDDD